MKVTIYTDGSARSNPEGPGGYGTIIEYIDPKGVKHEKELSAGFPKTTNNRMELMAVIAGLEALNRPCTVEVVSDSKYVTEAFNAGWIDNLQKNGWKTAGKKEVLNADLWTRLLSAMSSHSVTFRWVKGHDGHEQNERCDRLATAAADALAVLDDTDQTE